MSKTPVRIGFSETFNSTQSDLMQFNGSSYTLLEKLDEKKYDKDDVGRMYVIQFPGGEITDAFEDEISEYKEA